MLRGRPRAGRGPAGLDAIFRPRSVAVLGASREPRSIGREVLGNLLGGGFTGKVFPVNPRADAVAGLKCYATVEAIPDPVDLAVLVVPAAAVLSAARACARKGVRALVVISAGFREVGGEGAEREAALFALCRRHRIRLVGPNCIGVMNTDPAVSLNATFAANAPLRGRAAFVTQSGALGEAILADARAMGLGLSLFASIGNRADVSGNDLLAHFGADPRTSLVLMYLESFGNPENFAAIAREVARRKPVVAVKSGRTARGARAAGSHTGAIAARDVAVDSVLAQCGVLRVGTMKELFTLAAAFANQPIPRGNRVAIVSNAGGPAVLATDAAIAAGLALPEFARATARRLRRALPPEASVANPIDLIASADAARYDAVLRAVLPDPGVDALLVVFVSPIHIDSLEVARAIARHAARSRKPVLCTFMGKVRDEEAVATLQSARLPVYRFPEEAVAALAAMNRYRELRDRPEGKIPRRRVDLARARRAVARARDGWLPPERVEALLAAYGFPLARTRRVGTAAEAIEAANEIGYPVALKGIAKGLVHKTEAGAVRLDLRNADELARAHRELAGRLRPRRVRFEVQRMAEGVEVILGAWRDPQFGPLLLVGLGGIFVEQIGDVAVRVHPITDRDAGEMVRSLRGAAILQGARGASPRDVPFLEEALGRLSRLVGDFPEIAEMDLNPLMVFRRGEGGVVVDARVRLGRSRP